VASPEREEELLERLLERVPKAPETVATAAAAPALAQVEMQRLVSNDLERLLDPAPLAAECGWGWLADGCGYAASRVEMPGVRPEMIEWWFTWFPHHSLRYRIWHPRAHFATELVREPTPAASRSDRRTLPFWGAVHDSTEDVGFGRRRLRIRFVEPWKLGFPRDTLERPNVGLVSCAVVGEPRLGVEHTCLAHVFLRSPDDGLVLRSRFWIGAALRPYGPRLLGRLATPLLRRKLVRRVAIPRVAPRSLLLHCGEEFANLAAILPDLYTRFGRPS